MTPATAVISYSHFDSPLLARFHTHLAMLRREGGILAWHDRDILAGTVVDEEIHRHIESCGLFIVLVSPDFLNSRYCYETEMQHAVELHNANRLRIVPIILEPCDWLASPLSQFKALPRDGKPISGWPNLNAAFLDVVTELRRIVQSRQETIASASPQDKPARKPLRSVTGSAAAAPAARPQLPYVTFPYEIDRFMNASAYRRGWAALDAGTRHRVTHLGTKVEPIVAISGSTPIPTPVVLGFEALALGSAGENFGELSRMCAQVDGAALRIGLAIAAVKSIAYLRDHARPANLIGARKLKFSLNLDPVMLDSPLLKQFLLKYEPEIERLVFEVNETTTTRYLRQLKNLRVDFQLRLCADDINRWHKDVRQELIDCVEATKMDHPSFKEAMDMRGEDPAAAIRLIRANAARGKPLIVEGVDDPDYVMFLQRNWDPRKYGELWGQGYILDPGIHWDGEMQSLKRYGLPGGNLLRRKPEDDDPDISFGSAA